MKLRKINVKLLFLEGFVYRCFIIICNALFFATGLKPSLDRWGTIGASLCWNLINMTLYYFYHFFLLKLFKFESKGVRDGRKDTDST